VNYEALGSLDEWAEKPRTVLISKCGTPFCAPEYIDSSLQRLFEELEENKWLEGSTLDEFLDYLSYLVSEINAIHPFREGNARTIRFFADVLAARTFGDIFEWVNAPKDEFLLACINGFSGNYGLMRQILEKC
jgi:cell filamentation protein